MIYWRTMEEGLKKRRTDSIRQNASSGCVKERIWNNQTAGDCQDTSWETIFPELSGTLF